MADQSGVGVRSAPDGAEPLLREGRPKARAVGPVCGRRVLLATCAVVVLVLGLMLAARMLGDGGWRVPLLAGLGAVVVLPIAATAEWYVHRFVYHEPVLRPLGAIFRVHTAHHYAFFPTWRYVTSGPARRLSIRWRTPDIHSSSIRNAGVRLAHFAWYLGIGFVLVWVPSWFVTRSVPFLVGAVVGTAVVSNLFIVVHDTIHRPRSHRLVEAQPWFAFLDRHHYIHHIDLGANLNFLLPLGDLLFGTLRTSLTAEERAEHGDLEAAKARRIGSGERAKSVIR